MLSLLLGVTPSSAPNVDRTDVSGSMQTAQDVSKRPILVLVEPSEDDVLEAVRIHLGAMGDAIRVETDWHRKASLGSKVRDALRRIAACDARAAFVVEREEHDMVLYLVEGRGEQLLVRRIPLPESRAAGLETLGVVLRSLVDAIVADRHVGMTAVAVAPDDDSQTKARAEPTSPLSPASSRPQPKSWGFRLMAEYLGANVSDRLVWQHGFGARVALEAPARVFAELGYGYFPGTSVRGDGLAMTIERHRARGAAGYAVRLPYRLALDLGVHAGLEPTIRRVSSSSPSLRASKDGVSIVGIAGALGRIRVVVEPGVALELSAGLSVVANPVDYTVEGVPEPSRLMSMSRLRGELALAIGWSRPQ